MANLIEIGKIVNTHGIRGEVKIMPWCDDPFMYCDFSYFYADGIRYEIDRARVHKNTIIVQLSGVDNIDSANAMRNRVITIEREVLGDLNEGVYYVCDLIGIEVMDEGGQILGTINEVIKTGSNDVYELSSGVLVPALKHVVLSVDIEAKRMVVRLPEGLLD